MHFIYFKWNKLSNLRLFSMLWMLMDSLASFAALLLLLRRDELRGASFSLFCASSCCAAFSLFCARDSLWLAPFSLSWRPSWTGVVSLTSAEDDFFRIDFDGTTVAKKDIIDYLYFTKTILNQLRLAKTKIL